MCRVPTILILLQDTNRPWRSLSWESSFSFSFFSINRPSVNSVLIKWNGRSNPIYWIFSLKKCLSSFGPSPCPPVGPIRMSPLARVTRIFLCSKRQIFRNGWHTPLLRQCVPGSIPRPNRSPLSLDCPSGPRRRFIPPLCLRCGPIG